jgi:hypothetical protein
MFGQVWMTGLEFSLTNVIKSKSEEEAGITKALKKWGI